MSESLSSFASDLSSDLQCTREEMRLAQEFGRSLQKGLVEIISQFAKFNFSREISACPITKIAGFKLETTELDPDLWSFSMAVKVGISRVDVWINKGPGIVLFEFWREYTPKTAVFRRAAVRFEQVETASQAAGASISGEGSKQNWTSGSLWLTETTSTEAWVTPEKLSMQIIKHLMKFDIAADLDALVEQECHAS